MVEMEEERLRMREHVMNEVQLHTGTYSYEITFVIDFLA